MKKIILILNIILLTGCYDYSKLNELSIISSIGIDYLNDNYEITFEIIDNDYNHNITLTAENIEDAFYKINNYTSKKPYFYHLKAIIINKEMANKINEIIDYFLRNPKIIHAFYLVISDNVNAKEFLNIDKNNKGNNLEKFLENNPYHYSELFEGTIENFYNSHKNALINTFSIKNNQINLSGLAVYKNYELVTILKDKEYQLLNLLLNKSNYNLEDNNITINIYQSKTKITFSNQINIIINAESQIINSKNKQGLKNSKTYPTLNKNFSNLLKKEIITLLNNFNELKIDPLNINYQFYQTYQKELKNYNYNVEINLKVNKKGLIFEAPYDK